jgi:zinc transport system substrate-binding protein
MVQAIDRGACSLDAREQGCFPKNSQAYVALLDELDQELVDIFAEMSPKIFIVYHPAFGYIAEDYNLEMVA